MFSAKPCFLVFAYVPDLILGFYWAGQCLLSRSLELYRLASSLSHPKVLGNYSQVHSQLSQIDASTFVPTRRPLPQRQATDLLPVGLTRPPLKPRP
jgi:hypothetical protein